MGSCLHLILPEQEEFVHNYNLRSGVSHIMCPSCRTKCTQECDSTFDLFYFFQNFFFQNLSC